jgi:hypothetical protein
MVKTTMHGQKGNDLNWIFIKFSKSKYREREDKGILCIEASNHGH